MRSPDPSPSPSPAQVIAAELIGLMIAAVLIIGLSSLTVVAVRLFM